MGIQLGRYRKPARGERRRIGGVVEGFFSVSVGQPNESLRSNGIFACGRLRLIQVKRGRFSQLIHDLSMRVSALGSSQIIHRVSVRVIQDSWQQQLQQQQPNQVRRLIKATNSSNIISFWHTKEI